MAEEPIFTKVAKGLPVNMGTAAARDWFRKSAQRIQSASARTLMRQNEQNLVDSINISSIGSLYQFVYDPKWKEKLPYYDVHPLIFVAGINPGGFSGINLHYLPPYARSKLMDALYNITLKEGDKMKVQISYDILNSARRFSLFKPCYKKYLRNHVGSRFLYIEPSQWDMAVMLPTARFVKAPEETVWYNSRKMY